MESRNERKRVVLSAILAIALVFQLCAVANSQVVYNGSTVIEPTYIADGIATYDITELNYGYLFIDGGGIVVNFTAAFGGDIYVGFLCSDTDCPGPTLNFGPGASASLIYAGSSSHINLRGGSVSFLLHVDPGAEVTIYGDKFRVDEIWQDPGTTLFGLGYVSVAAYDMWDSPLFNGDVSISSGASVLLDTETKDLGLDVQIDVKPGTNPCIINLSSNGVVPVAVLSDPDKAFDATLVLPATVEFAGAGVAVSGSGKYMAHVEDVDADGIADMLFHFRTGDLQLEDGVTEAAVTLTGQIGSLVVVQSAGLISDGTPISGTDNVYILRPKKK